MKYKKSCTEELINSRVQFSLATQFKILLKPLEKSPFWDRGALLVKYTCISGLPWHLHIHKHMLLHNQLYQRFAALILETTNNDQLVPTVCREPLHPLKSLWVSLQWHWGQTKTQQIPRAQYLVSSGNRLPPALQQVQRFPAHDSESALEAFPDLRKRLLSQTSGKNLISDSCSSL